MNPISYMHNLICAAISTDTDHTEHFIPYATTLIVYGL